MIVFMLLMSLASKLFLRFLLKFYFFKDVLYA